MDRLPKIGTSEGGWTRNGILQLGVFEGYRPPFWYGLAWWSPMSRMAICYPIPLNWIMWALREIYWFIKVTPRQYNHPLWKEGYKVGRRDAMLLRDCGEKDEDTISV